MTPIRVHKRLLQEGEEHTGVLWFTNGVPTHVVEFYVEWSHRAKLTYDNELTAWKILPMDERPSIILDSDENEVIL